MDMAGLCPDRNHGVTPCMRLRNVELREPERPGLYEMMMGRATPKEVWQARMLVLYIWVATFLKTWPEGRIYIIPLVALFSWIPVRHVMLHDGFDEEAKRLCKIGAKRAIEYVVVETKEYHIRFQEAWKGMHAIYQHRMNKGYNISQYTGRLATFLKAYVGKNIVRPIDAYHLYAKLLTGHMAIEYSQDGVKLGVNPAYVAKIARQRTKGRSKRATAVWHDRMKILAKLVNGEALGTNEAEMVFVDHAIIMGCSLTTGIVRVEPRDNDAEDLMKIMNSFDVGAYYFFKDEEKVEPTFGVPMHLVNWEWVPV